MPISRDLNCVFIHIPKTGGTSIEAALDMQHKECFFADKGPDIRIDGYNYQPQHLTLSHLQEELNKDFLDSAFKFTIIRNPYDRAISEYFWRGKITQKDKFDPSYKDFLLWVKQFYTQSRHCHAIPQSYYFDGPLYDYVGTTETINDSWVTIQRELNIPPRPLPWKFNTGSDLYKDRLLTGQSKAVIERLFKDDFKLYERYA